MRTKALIKTAELTRLARLAKLENVTVELEREGVTIRIMPFYADVEKPLSALDRWKQDMVHSSTETERRNAKSHSIDPDKVIQDWYDRLGYDPKTMDAADFKRLSENADAEWLASIPSRKMLKSEEYALRQLAAYGVGVPVYWRKIKGCGPGTQERLVARDFLEVRMQEKFPDRIEMYLLTQKGFDAFKAFDTPPP